MCFAFDGEGTLLHNLTYNENTPARFMDTFAFRMAITSLFFVPIFVMVVCYTHILFVVKKQQNRWNDISRMGSIRTKGRGSHKICREKKQLESNVRALYTTLLILGSCFIGWTPALLFYTLACSKGCYLQGEALVDLNCNHRTTVLILRLTDNMLVILKMLANPIIYSIRMREIKDGTHRMSMALLGVFCPSRRDDMISSGYYYRSRNQNSTGGTIQLRLTSFKSANRNGSHIALGKDCENAFL
ncbi:uncharacterized protein LOC132707394 [Cylas formicarius]|uniref:uncharacterized protein LOC132707394 n=1 Tax=Cylas formicarius TaxID=197179 RepID=UPI0029585C33|nr:uncharacterized protein LOC132707394 [Cylas formicarius]